MLAHGGEGLDQQTVKLGAAIQPVAERLRARRQGFVTQRFVLRLQGVDGLHVSMQALDETVVRGPEEPLGK